jgi:RNA polymerase sigma factor (sigma-70 family)
MTHSLRLMPSATHPEPPTLTAVTPHGTRGGLDVVWATRGTGRGEQAAFEALYRAWFERVFAFARGLTRRDESFCLDVTQDVMVRAAKSIPELQTEAELGAWMTRAAVSASVDLIRREERRKRREAQSMVNAAAQVRADSDSLRWLRGAVAELPEVDQLLLMQRIANGVTLQEAGASVGIGEHAAHGRVRRALGKLRTLAREVWP